MVGSISADRYERIVARLRDAVEELSKSQFIIGDGALEVCPMQDHGGRSVAGDLFGVAAWLHRLSEDVDVPYNTLKSYRWGWVLRLGRSASAGSSLPRLWL
ncbi:hypothetical protein [Streptomyces sp. NPDC020607]|uniref:hypothetical protein n=1 Tax=Streptomyces sp. NPDC020607 TaxID=3365082 RepID=UPI003795A5B4